MEKAVVSTTLGAEGLAVVPGEHLIIADNPEAFAQAVVSLLRDANARKRLGQAGRTLVTERYQWDRLATKMSGFLGGMIR